MFASGGIISVEVKARDIPMYAFFYRMTFSLVIGESNMDEQITEDVIAKLDTALKLLRAHVAKK